MIKKIALFLCLCSSTWYALAAPLVTRHVIVNDFEDNKGLTYELIDPMGHSYKDFLYPGTITLNLSNDNPQSLYGAYLLHYHACGLFTSSCVSHSKVLVITKNEEVIWEISKEGLVVTESDL